MDQAADWMRFIVRAALTLNGVFAAAASTFLVFFFVLRLTQWLYVHLLREPW